jgi:hypothetical protein
MVVQKKYNCKNIKIVRGASPEIPMIDIYVNSQLSGFEYTISRDPVLHVKVYISRYIMV